MLVIIFNYVGGANVNMVTERAYETLSHLPNVGIGNYGLQIELSMIQNWIPTNSDVDYHPILNLTTNSDFD